MPNVWTIHHGDVTGGATKSDLHGFHIKENDDGTAYIFVKGNVTYSTATNNGALPTPPFEFKDFGLDTYTWTVTVNTLTGGPSGNQAQGTWRNNAPPDPTEAQDGTFTAQAGSEGEGEGKTRKDGSAAVSA